MRSHISWAIAASAFLPYLVLASDVERIRELNQQIIAETNAKSVRRQASDAIRERASLLSSAIATDPTTAKSLFLAPATLQNLRAQRGVDASLLEHAFAYTGPVETTVQDQPALKRSIQTYVFESGGATVTAHGGPSLSLRCGDQARLEGLRIGNTALVTAAGLEHRADAVAECKTDGVQKVAVILANFPGKPAPTLTKAQISDLVFGTSGRSVVNFYKEASYGQVTLTGDVFGWYTLDRAYGCDEFLQLRTAALKAADAEIDFTRYSRVLVIHAGADCETVGQGTIGCQSLSSPGERFRASYASVGFTQAEDLLITTIHEFGHNFGLNHARTLRFPGTAIGPDRGLAAFEEYGDIFSVMGSGESHFSAAQKSTLGWLRTPGDYVAVQSSGTFDLLPLQSTGSGLKAIRVKRNTGDDALWIEYRQPIGAFDRSEAVILQSMFKGALIRAQSATDQLYSDLLDFTPASIDETRLTPLAGYFTDPVLPPGKTWQDPYSDLTLEVVSATPDRLRILVRYEAPCTTVSGISDGAVITAEGSPTPISVTAPGDCAYSATTSRSWLDVPKGRSQKGSANLTLEAQKNSSTLSRRASLTIDRKTFGVMQAGPAAKPSVSAFGPPTGSFPYVSWIPTTAVVSDANGVDDLKEYYILINDSQDELNSCMVRYTFADRTLALKTPSTNSYSLDTIRNGEWKFASNTRCGAGYPQVAAISDTEMLMGIDFAFLPNVQRQQEIYTMAVDRSGATTGWVRQGSLGFGTTCRVIPRPFRSDVSAEASVYFFELVPTSEPCAWQVTSGSPWIKVVNPTGKEYDVVLYTVDANPGPGSRTGTLTVGEYTLQVVQQAPGSVRLSDFTVTPAETTISSGSGVVTISVESRGGADWQATTTASWLSIIDKTSRSVTFFHDANSATTERIATLTIAGHSVVVRQLSGDPLRPAIASYGAVNAASFLTGISSGSWFTVRGVNLAPTTRTWASTDFVAGKLPTSLDGVRVLVNGKAAYLAYISPTQINALAPADTVDGMVPLQVENNGRQSLFEVTLRRTRAPGLFMMPAPVARLAAATLPDGTLVAPGGTFTGLTTRGANKGDVLSLYATGLGPTTPDYPEGKLFDQPLPMALPTVTIGNLAAKVSYAGLVSPGLYQINIEVPDLATGEYDIVLTVQGTRTQQKALLFVEHQ